MFNEIVNNLLERYYSTKLEKLDWISRNRLQIKKVLPEVNKQHSENKSKPERLKIAFWSATPWERGGVDHMLAMSLKARGHDVFGSYCDGKMSACSMESVMFPRGKCEDCSERNKKLINIWGLDDNYQATSNLIDKEVFEKINNLVDSTKKEDLESLTYKKIEIGKLAFMDLPQYFMKIADPEDPEVEAYLRRSIKGIAEYIHVAIGFVENVQPDRAIVTSGRTTSHSGFYQVCKSRNIPVITWDESVGGLGAFIFSLNNYAVDYHKPRAWERIAREPLTPEEDDFVQYYFSKTSKGKFGRHSYYNSPITDELAITKSIGIDRDKKIIVLLTNLTWDTSTIGKGAFFDGMMCWLEETIEYFWEKNDYQIIIRTHPAEGHLEDYAKGKESVSKKLHDKFEEFPKHIKVIRGEEEIHSHTLCDIASNIVVFTTSVGLEMASKGRKVMTVGKSHYRGKGFTHDLSSKEEYFRELLKASREGEYISDEMVALAKKYAYYFIVRTECYLEEFNIRDRHSYEIKNEKSFLPTESKRWDSLCAEIEDLGDFVDCTDYIDPWEAPKS